MEFVITQQPQYFILEYSTSLEQYTQKQSKVTKTLKEFQDFQQFVRLEFPYFLIPLSEPREYFKDLQKSQEGELIYKRILESKGCVQFLESTFHYSPQRKPNFKKIREIDVYYELVEKDVSEFQSILSGLGKMNDMLIQKEYGIAKSIHDLQQLLPFNSNDPKLRVYQKQLTTVVEFRKTFQEKVVEMLRFSDHVKEALSYRQHLLYSYDQACQTTQKKVIKMTKLQNSRSISSEKVDVLLEEMAVCKQQEQEQKDLLKFVGEVLKKEIESYKSKRCDDFENVIDEYTQLQINLLLS